MLLAALLAACASAPKPPSQPVARNVALRLNAANRLNLEKHGQSLALVVRIYMLRQRGAFDAAPYAAFLAPDAERAVLGSDLLDVREMTLVPGQRAESLQTLAPDAGFVGVVALFHAPATRGWRMSVVASDAERNGLALELGACSMRRAVAGVSEIVVRCQ
jgi:type VI secretion system protein VasD